MRNRRLNATSESGSPAFEGKQPADRAVDSRVQQDLSSTGNKGRPLEGSHHLSHVELRAEKQNMC